MRNALAHIIAWFLLFAVAGHLALGQDAQQKRQGITTRLAVAKTFFDRMPPLQRKALSAGAQNFRNLAENWAEGYIARAVRHGVGPMLSLARMIPARLSRRFPSAASA